MHRLEAPHPGLRVTPQGMGFPQYSKRRCRHSRADGAWLQSRESSELWRRRRLLEFIIPGRGMEVVNIGAVSFPAAVDQAIRAGLQCGEDMESILTRVEENIAIQVQQLASAYEKLLLPPAPYYSTLMTSCLERGRDLSKGAVYNNFGIHGAGSANAADALAAVQQFVFCEGTVSPSELLKALNADYEGYEDLREKLAGEGPKVGNDDQRADTLLGRLFNMLADACERYGKTSRGGILRPGSGSAMYYIWLTRKTAGMREPALVGATAEGRRSGQPLGANLAPSQGAAVPGPFSVLLSYSKIDYQRICKGGPITMELSDSVFRGEESYVRSPCWCALLPNWAASSSN